MTPGEGCDAARQDRLAELSALAGRAGVGRAAARVARAGVQRAGGFLLRGLLLRRLLLGRLFLGCLLRRGLGGGCCSSPTGGRLLRRPLGGGLLGRGGLPSRLLLLRTQRAAAQRAAAR